MVRVGVRPKSDKTTGGGMSMVYTCISGVLWYNVSVWCTLTLRVVSQDPDKSASPAGLTDTEDTLLSCPLSWLNPLLLVGSESMSQDRIEKSS